LQGKKKKGAEKGDAGQKKREEGMRKKPMPKVLKGGNA